jgi:alkylhydroperoxidase family enzyme
MFYDPDIEITDRIDGIKGEVHAVGTLSRRFAMARISLPDGDGEERQRMWRLRPELGESADHFSARVQDCSILSVREQEAARTRIAHINVCIPCSEARMDDMPGNGLDEHFYADVSDLGKRGRYSERERLAIEFAERFAWGSEYFDDLIWARLRQAFSDAELVDLATACAKWLGLGRMNAVLELERSCPIVLRAPQRSGERIAG